jgi:hypothetical protein
VNDSLRFGRLEGTVESVQAWLEVACLAYLFTRLPAERP